MSNYFFFRTLLCLTFSAVAVMYSTLFRKLPDPSQVVFTIITSVNASGINVCAVKCLRNELACFVHNRNLRRCDMGNCKSRSLTSKTIVTFGSGEDLYLTCDRKAGFQLFTSGSVKTCAFVSSNEITYTAAREACRAKAAYMYTVKNLDKLKILQNFFLEKYSWVGLNDMEVEGVYRWDDDNSILNPDLTGHIFQPGEPNNGLDIEDCTRIQKSGKLYDIPCYATNFYICEQPFLNFH